MQALPKGDRGELAVELATEAGVDEIVPWAASRCVARWTADRADRGHRPLADCRAGGGEAVETELRAAWSRSWRRPLRVAARIRQAAGAVLLHEAARRCR